MVETDRGIVYIQGQDGMVTLTARVSPSGGPRTELNIPERATALRISYDKEGSKGISSSDLIARYLRLRSSKMGGAAGIKAADEAAFAQSATAARARCHASFSARIDWSTLPAPFVSEIDIGDRCSDVLKALAQICADNLGQESVGKLKQIVCRGGVHPKVELNASELRWSIVQEESADVQFTARVIELRL